MKLSADETRKLIASADGQPLIAVIEDACELLTLKTVLLIKAWVKQLKIEMHTKELGTPERNNLAQQVNGLNRFMVELSEAP